MGANGSSALRQPLLRYKPLSSSSSSWSSPSNFNMSNEECLEQSEGQDDDNRRKLAALEKEIRQLKAAISKLESRPVPNVGALEREIRELKKSTPPMAVPLQSNAATKNEVDNLTNRVTKLERETPWDPMAHQINKVVQKNAELECKIIELNSTVDQLKSEFSKEFSSVGALSQEISRLKAAVSKLESRLLPPSVAAVNQPQSYTPLKKEVDKVILRVTKHVLDFLRSPEEQEQKATDSSNSVALQPEIRRHEMDYIKGCLVILVFFASVLVGFHL